MCFENVIFNKALKQNPSQKIDFFLEIGSFELKPWGIISVNFRILILDFNESIISAVFVAKFIFTRLHLTAVLFIIFEFNVSRCLLVLIL